MQAAVAQGKDGQSPSLGLWPSKMLLDSICATLSAEASSSAATYTNLVLQANLVLLLRIVLETKKMEREVFRDSMRR
jgi:hypothetical protein